MKMTTEEFIRKSIEKHGSKFDYSEVIFNGTKNKVSIKCLAGHKFDQSPNSHLAGSGCRFCAKKVPYTRETFIAKAKIIHDYKFSYDNLVWNGTKYKIEFSCNDCGTVINIKAQGHIASKGCRKCVRFGLRLTTEKFIRKAIKIHGDKYDYSKTNYVLITDKVEIFCRNCDKYFSQTPSIHLEGSGCYTCGNKERGIARLMSNAEFERKARIVHGEKYGYEDVNMVHTRINVSIYCRSCKKHFSQRPANHLHVRGGCGCPNCTLRVSKGEIAFLDLVGISEDNRQKRIGKYLVDGYDPDTNTVYEYDGDFYHGNPAMYDQNEVNRVTGKTHAESYKRTIDKREALRSLGYNVIAIWESELPKFKEEWALSRQTLIHDHSPSATFPE
jgi:very-short-patch-repair endonuclease